MVPDEKLQKLGNAKRGKKYITTTAVNYDILGDPRNQSAFYYVTLDKRHDHSASLYDFIPSILY